MRTFYRVAHKSTKQGLWYNSQGEFKGLIHNAFSFCKNSNLEMPFDPEAIGFLSATDSIEDLYNWFPQKDILRLEDYGFIITVYEAEDFKFYNSHWLIDQRTSKIISQVSLKIKELEQCE